MIVDLMDKKELREMSITKLEELRDSVITVLKEHQTEKTEEFRQHSQQKEADRIFQNIKKNAIALADMERGTDFGWEIQQLLEQKKFTDVIKKVAEFDFENRDRPNFDESRYTKENQTNVRAVLIFENMKENWLYCDDFPDKPIDVGDAFYHYSVGHKDIIPFLLETERHITEETVQRYIQDMGSDQELSRNLFFKVIMQAEENGEPHPRAYTFINAFSEDPLPPLPFQLKRIKTEYGEKSPVRSLKEVADSAILSRSAELMAEKDQAVRDADYERAGELREQLYNQKA